MQLAISEFEARRHKREVVIGKLQHCMWQSSEEATPHQRMQRRQQVYTLMSELQCRRQLSTVKDELSTPHVTPEAIGTG